MTTDHLSEVQELKSKQGVDELTLKSVNEQHSKTLEDLELVKKDKAEHLMQLYTSIGESMIQNQS